jgi:hypothetical protein
LGQLPAILKAFIALFYGVFVGGAKASVVQLFTTVGSLLLNTLALFSGKHALTSFKEEMFTQFYRDWVLTSEANLEQRESVRFALMQAFAIGNSLTLAKPALTAKYLSLREKVAALQFRAARYLRYIKRRSKRLARKFKASLKFNRRRASWRRYTALSQLSTTLLFEVAQFNKITLSVAKAPLTVEAVTLINAFRLKVAAPILFQTSLNYNWLMPFTSFVNFVILSFQLPADAFNTATGQRFFYGFLEILNLVAFRPSLFRLTKMARGRGWRRLRAAVRVWRYFARGARRGAIALSCVQLDRIVQTKQSSKWLAARDQRWERLSASL